MDLVQNILGPYGPLMIVGGLGVVLIGIAMSLLLGGKEDPLDKLKRARAEEEKAKTTGGARLRTASKQDKLEKYAGFLEPQNEEAYSSARMKLIRAGFRSKASVRIYFFLTLTMGIGGLILGLIYTLVSGGMAAGITPLAMATILVPGLIGYMGPKRYVSSRGEKRKKEIIDGFPDALDLMLVCVEAGQSLDQAILRVAREIASSYPALSEEFQMVSYEIKAGKDRSSVLKDMGERVDVPDVASFVTVLVQSASFGTPISEALRVYAAEMRDKRLMRAEEAANQLPTKMTLMTMAFTVPPLMIILVGPSVYDVTQTLGSGGGIVNF
ncbi:type II secretion system F family protein [Anianabacter salinae]|uniref:type II secretion system F family protein n=1 Tax=Anianabacter salinae TaxID=2851023 RepID=UPI00225DD5A5|nr:type II secretion system F family protein [Anianabacter salinae]MBV0911282.1 type II secretion system F family protein [Anianabacter salinae]